MPRKLVFKLSAKENIYGAQHTRKAYFFSARPIAKRDAMICDANEFDCRNEENTSYFKGRVKTKTNLTFSQKFFLKRVHSILPHACRVPRIVAPRVNVGFGAVA